MKDEPKNRAAQDLVRKRWAKASEHEAAKTRLREFWNSKTPKERAELMRQLRDRKVAKREDSHES